MVVQAAAEGQGVALARRRLAAADLAAGRLIQPFEVTIPHDLAYYLVCPEATAEQPKIAAFRGWLLAEAASEGDRDGVSGGLIAPEPAPSLPASLPLGRHATA